MRVCVCVSVKEAEALSNNTEPILRIWRIKCTMPDVVQVLHIGLISVMRVPVWKHKEMHRGGRRAKWFWVQAKPLCCASLLG